MKKSLLALLHVGYWCVYLLLAMMMTYILFTGEEGDNGADEVMMFLAFLLLVLLPAVATFYVAYLVLFPRLFRKKRIGMALLAVAGVSLVMTGSGLLLLAGVFYPQCATNADVMDVLQFLTMVAVLNFVGGLVAFVLRGFSTWFEEVKLKEALQEKNHAMELALVKSQLDPHFLFNTINNIDVLILKDPVEASDYLNRLSDIMRFMLYETKTEQISLRQELIYLGKYIALQKIRTANPSYVDFRVSGDPEGKRIAPMVLIPFIENAFKHTHNKKTADAIRINLQISNDHLRLQCTNRLATRQTEAKAAGGLGNELIRKRLELLYPGRYTLTSERRATTYHVDLKIHY